MKLSFVILTLFLSLFSIATAQELMWQKSFGGANADAGLDIVATSDGGLLAVGYTSSLNNTPSSPRSGYLVRLKSDGSVMWEKDISDHYVVELHAVFDNGDNTFTVIGDGIQEPNGPLGKIRIYMARVDQQGELIWEKFLSDSLQVIPVINARRYSSGGFVILARTQFGNPHLVRVSEQGEVQWSKTVELKPDQDTPAANVRELADGSLVITGRAWDAMYLMKLSAEGDSLWLRQYRARQAGPQGRDIIEKPDGTFLVIGYTDKPIDGSDGHLYIVHADADGNSIDTFHHVSPPRNEIMSAQRTSDGGLILVGRHGEGENTRAYFVRTDSDGKVLWEFITESDDLQSNIAVRQLDDGSFVAVGSDTLGMLITRISDPVSAVEEIRALPTSINLW